MKNVLRVTALAWAIGLSIPALAQSATAGAPVVVSGGILTSQQGMTLYVFDKDVANSGKSACNGPCATNWPPLMAAEEALPSGEYSIVVRDDGSRQWAVKGKPLYLWIKDQKPGDTTGDGVNQIWRVAKP